MEIKTALAELRKGKQRKFDQTLDLIVNLKNFDVRKEALNTFIAVPNSGQKKICAFLNKTTKLVDTIIADDFSRYKENKDLKKLAKRYDMFLAAAPLMGKVATTFGRVFGPMNKMPSPLSGIIMKEDEASIKEMVEKMNKMVRVKNKEMAIKLPIGKFSMKDSELEENIQAAIKGLEAKLPRANDNIKEVLIKFTMTKPILIVDKK